MLRSLVLTVAILTVTVSACAQLEGRTEISSASLRENPLQLRYEVHGQGDPVLFLHGFGQNTYTWRYLVEPLSKHRRLILVDLKGFGASPKPFDAEYALADQALLIHRFVLRLGLTNLTVVGHSFGGGVALLTALRLEDEEPERLRALVLLDSVAYPQRLPTFMKLLRTPILGRLGLGVLPSQLLARHVLELAYYDASEIAQATVEAYAEPLKSYDGRHAVLETAKRIIPPDLEELTARYATLEVPTLLVWGRQDELVPLWVGRRLHRALPNSRLAVIEDSGHLPHEEKPAEVASAMLSFFEEAEDHPSAAAASLGSSSRAPRTRLHDSAAGTSAPDRTSRRSATRCNRHVAEAAPGA